MNYKKMGKGKPVVLIHGFAEDGSIWDNQVEYLSGKFQLIIPDIPGSGESPLQKGANDMESFAEEIALILRKESITACAMLGHSMGGYITLAFAEKFPNLLSAMGLIHSTSFPDNDEKKRARQKSIEFIRQYGSAKFIEQSTPNLFSEEFRKNSPEIVSACVKRYTNFSEDSLVQYYEAMMHRSDRTGILKEFIKPVLFVMGVYDSTILLENSLKQCYWPKISYIKVLEHSGHMACWKNLQ